MVCAQTKREEAQMTQPVWEITKSESGESFSLHVGPRGVPGSVAVHNLPRPVAAALGDALYEIEKRAAHRALANVRDALGVN